MRPVTPVVAVDVIVELVDEVERPIVLVERRNSPAGWAIPGGFVDVGESLELAAVRELREETGLSVILDRLLGVYSDPGRDPRGHTVTAVYIAHAHGIPEAGDDAAGVGTFDPSSLPRPLAFDHEQVLADYLKWRGTGELPPPRPHSMNPI